MKSIFKWLVVSLVIGVAVCVPRLVLAQDSWRERPFSEWTKRDVTKLLNDSPWARTQTVRIATRKQMRSVAGQVSATPGSGPVPTDSQAALGGADAAVDYSFTIRLRSSLPIRQAIVRLVQLDAKYDSMKPGQKKLLDEQTRELLECRECVDNYIISVGFGSTNSSGVDPIYDWFRGQSVESLKGYIYIQNDQGKQRELTGFIPPRVVGDEAFFLFTRNDMDGKPLLTPKNKNLLFRMSDANAGSVTNFRLDVSRMVVDGKLEF
jgi:hypothetical protein